jgi:hypothetical protein
MNEILAETLATLRAAGFEPRVDTHSRHFKVKFTDRCGRTRLIVVSHTPGTSFALHRSRALVRRILRSSSLAPPKDATR